MIRNTKTCSPFQKMRSQNEAESVWFLQSVRTERLKAFVVRTSGEYSSIKEINNTVLATKGAYNVKLSDVGRAFFGYKDETESVYINGKPGVYISVTKQSGTNAVKVADALL